MTDYAAAPITPIVQGLITINAQAVPVFTGKGVSAIARTGGGGGTGDFTLTLDVGLPGNAGEVNPGGAGANGPRSLVQARGSATNAIPGGTSIAAIGVSYGTPAPAPGDGGDTTIRIVTTSAAAALVDPTGAVASGLEVIVWKGVV